MFHFTFYDLQKVYLMVKKGFIDRIMSSFVLRMFWNNLGDGLFIALGKDEVDQEGGWVGHK